MEAIALAVLSVTGLYFLVLGAVSLLLPAQARQFLLGFAASPSKHYAELFARFAVGGSLILSSPQLFHPAAFGIFGWVLIVTSAVLIIIPWQWHQRFAQQAVPRSIRYMPLIGVSSLALGGLLLTAVVIGAVP